MESSIPPGGKIFACKEIFPTPSMDAATECRRKFHRTFRMSFEKTHTHPLYHAPQSIAIFRFTQKISQNLSKITNRFS